GECEGSLRPVASCGRRSEARRRSSATPRWAPRSRLGPIRWPLAERLPWSLRFLPCSWSICRAEHRLAHHPTGPDRPRGSTDVLAGDGVLLVGAGAAIDEEELAGHEPGLRRGEVDDHAGDVLPGAKTSERRAGHLPIAKPW